ncbi:MAG: ANTAR domain-containing protein, partial [Candidatus Omnitrophica bacterium]|nr:ANTAR domain-containing protein [Candidatus Omnitrophota bacterium]
ALAIENTKLLADKVAAIENLETRKKVDRAKGILINRHKIGEAEAYRRMQKQSMEKRKALKEVAEAIITSEDLASLK